MARASRRWIWTLRVCSGRRATAPRENGELASAVTTASLTNRGTKGEDASTSSATTSGSAEFRGTSFRVGLPRDGRARLDARGEVLSMRPTAFYLSNGPGDPASMTAVVEEIRTSSLGVPTFGICFGHQLLAGLRRQDLQAALRHRGGNQPVKDLHTAGRDPSHNTASPRGREPAREVEVTHVTSTTTASRHRHKRLPVISVQYHRRRPRPHDARTTSAASSSMETERAAR